MKKVRVGFIGCGGIAQFHFGHMEKIPEVEVVAACDLIEERAQKTAERFGATPYLCYKEMFEKEQLDAVYVCVHPSAHDGMEFMAIERGIHLFVQKPMSLDLDYARRVRDGIAEKGLVSAVGLQCRYADSIPRVKAWLNSQKLGMVLCARLGGTPMVWWWREKKHSGGQVVEQTIHNYDILRFFLGEVVAVQAMARKGVVTDIENYDVEDASTVNMQFESGVVANLSTGCFGGVGNGDMEFYSREGMLKYGIGGNFSINQGKMTITGKAGNDSGLECDDTFIQAVLENDPSLVLSPYSDAYKSLELTLAINKSMDSGGELVRI